MILAHGSGIDDILLFVVPVLIALALLRMAERKARRRAESAGAPEAGPTEASASTVAGPTESEVPPLSSPADE